MLIDLPDPNDTDIVTFSRIPTETGWILRGSMRPEAIPAHWSDQRKSDVICMPLWERLRKGVYVGCGISTTFFVERFLRKCRYEDFDWKIGMSIDDILQGSHQVQAPDCYT